MTGLSETPGIDDHAEFIKLCETYLSSKPYVIKCERIGQSVDNRPQVQNDTVTATVVMLRLPR